MLAFDIPTRFADKIPGSFVIKDHEPYVIHFLAPLMNPERPVSVLHPSEDKTDAFMNSFKDPEKRQSKVSSVAPIPNNQSSWARFQAVSPHLFLNDQENSIPCSTLDESFHLCSLHRRSQLRNLRLLARTLLKNLDTFSTTHGSQHCSPCRSTSVYPNLMLDQVYITFACAVGNRPTSTNLARKLAEL